MTDFYKILHLGARQVGRPLPAPTFAQVKYAGGRLSISAVEGPRPNGDCWGSCGQCVFAWLNPDDAPNWVKLGEGWTRDQLALFLLVWDRWHLNDLRAGTPAQEAYLQGRDSPSSFSDRLELLTRAGLEPDPETGYRYGSRWLTEEVPAEVLNFLRNLPESTITPAWI